MKILILYGPNINLLGIWASKNKQTYTMDKINTHIKKYVKNKNIDTKFLQTNSESKAVSYIQKNRNKIDGIIIVPGPWQYSAYSLADILELIEKPFITIAYKVKDYIKLLNGIDNLIDDNPYRAFENAIDIIENKLI